MKTSLFSVYSQMTFKLLTKIYYILLYKLERHMQVSFIDRIAVSDAMLLVKTGFMVENGCS